MEPIEGRHLKLEQIQYKELAFNWNTTSSSRTSIHWHTQTHSLIVLIEL